MITTDKLSKTFSNAGTQQHVLKNLDLEIERGSFTVIMGPSGAGKSTLLYALSGMDRPTLGTVEFDGETISGYSEDKLAKFRRRHCGFMFQQIHLLDSLSVMDNVMAVGLLTGDRRTVKERGDKLFDLVGLSVADRRKFPGMLSGGEAARVALVRGLIAEPGVLFADEPTGQLNSEFSRIVLDLLAAVNATGQTVVMVTHDIRSAAYGSRILYLRDGTIQGELSLADLPQGDAAARQNATAEFLAEMGW
ncbi:ABC transporter ATP-binding protein [Tessaracoccus lubricantis]